MEIVDKFYGPWNIFRPLDICNLGRFVNSVVILVYYFPILVCCTKKNLATPV
jgi:hypothetical protein